MTINAKLIATAQVVISVAFLVGYFAILAIFLLGWVKTPPDWKDAMMVLLGVLTAGVGLILSFWFQRQRAAAGTSEQ